MPISGSCGDMYIYLQQVSPRQLGGRWTGGSTCYLSLPLQQLNPNALNFGLKTTYNTYTHLPTIYLPIFLPTYMPNPFAQIMPKLTISTLALQLVLKIFPKNAL